MRGNETLVITLIISALALSGCGEQRVYRDTSELEMPPQLEGIASAKTEARPSAEAATAKPETVVAVEAATPKPESASQPEAVTETSATKSEPAKQIEAAVSKKNSGTGLGDVVKMLDETHLQIKYPFDESWKLMKIAITLNPMEISDRNRDKGQYFVEFDPDVVASKENENLFTSLFNSNKYPKGRYLLTLTEDANMQSVDIKAEFLEYTESDSSLQDGGYSTSAPSDNGLTRFVEKIYSTLHDDLPLTP